MRHPRRAFRREELLQEVWGYRYGDTSTVTVHVRRLREKVEADPATPARIATVWASATGGKARAADEAHRARGRRGRRRRAARPSIVAVVVRRLPAGDAAELIAISFGAGLLASGSPASPCGVSAAVRSPSGCGARRCVVALIPVAGSGRRRARRRPGDVRVDPRPRALVVIVAGAGTAGVVGALRWPAIWSGRSADGRRPPPARAR